MRTSGRTSTVPRVLIPALPAALLAALLLGGCAGGGSHGESATDARAPAAAPNKAAAGGAQAGRATAGASTGTGKNVNVAQAVAGRSVVYTADLRVQARDVAASAAEAKRLTAEAGGYVASETTSSGRSGATLVLKIPTARYPAALDRLGSRLGTRTALHQQAEDVTEQVADVTSRVRSAQASLASFRKLLDRAGTIEEITSLENQIEQRQADLEALQARQRALAQSTSYATLTVRLAPPPVATAGKPEEHGFVPALKDGWHALAAAVGALLTLLGWLLPFAAVALVVAVPALLLRRRLRGRPAPAVEKPADAG
ncbi:DUF4349 domain-containing protein [Actinomadura parmotrematis]|uniref:DUF4349 domain-containing protein n=1 Tax=Actinomadura parmotrematis TaxID=2864039 RepID=A0ABS7FS31_9ACTN|nr:DUF4349 domain-containing protein [Actinomadura parmotrematis]MBW8482367.1 DUF4349 domain-containing protein [Actinomadura parmotrematis]